ncbi:L-gulonolactone/D-arabinono-1,4-lactone oxidase [Auriscalpium vulgare]|uniref:L-gulonolactone/D-arabinono-1,4-lactone oxidase n=1 Tax=Auriscalpium vulgare TaxID=40419 RepID=A0ACB8S9B9_9AGAM|nr:L-gulonolactone/D-arabinono-1,4-lactone oxidase [Auriscalpium vulgare]
MDRAAALQPIVARDTAFANWARTFRCTPLAIFDPTTKDDVRRVLALARAEGRPVRAVGVGHSPSDLACTSGYMVRMAGLKRVLEIDPQKLIVRAEGGITLAALHAALAAHGLAMRNVGSISDQTLAGMVTTATHGTGIGHCVLSTDVLAAQLLLADGTTVRCTPDQNEALFAATLCGLGSTGIILDLTLRVVPAFRLRETQRTLPFDAVVGNLDAIVHSAEFVRMWWWPQAGAIRTSAMDRTVEVRRPSSPPCTCVLVLMAVLQERRPASSWLWHSLIGYHLLQFLLFVGLFLPSFNLWVGRFTAWLVRDDTVAVDNSLDIFNIDCKYRQHTTEWAIPYAQAQACLQVLRTWFDEEFANPAGLRPHCALEIRFSAADDVWLSPCYAQETCWIGVVQYKPYGLNVPYRALFREFERIVASHGGRPHWAKAHRLRPQELVNLYPRFNAFRDLLQEVDPNGVLRNEYVERHVFGREGPMWGDRVFKARA